MSKLNDLNILLWDIETLPNIGCHWGMWKQNIAASQIVQQGEMLCISYKWLHSTKVHNISPIAEPGFKQDSYAYSGWLAERFIPVLEKADFAVAHNGDAFDYKKLKAYAIIADLPPFKVRKVDTLKMAKATGFFPKGNKLDNLALVLGIEQKYRTSMAMWMDIALRRQNMIEQMEKMNRYCDQDVRVLEQVFLKLWPHSESILPNVHILTGGSKEMIGCDRCGSEEHYKNGTYIKNVLVYQRYKCNRCGAAFLGRKAIDVKGA
jgi:hypothetical protein